MNEYIMTRSVFAGFSGVVYDLDEVAGVPPVRPLPSSFHELLYSHRHARSSATRTSTTRIRRSSITSSSRRPSWPAARSSSMCMSIPGRRRTMPASRTTTQASRSCSSAPTSRNTPAPVRCTLVCPSHWRVRALTTLFSVIVGGIVANPVTKRNERYWTNGKSYALRASARTVSCNAQLSACAQYAKSHTDVSIVGCAAQEAKCLLQVLQ